MNILRKPLQVERGRRVLFCSILSLLSWYALSGQNDEHRIRNIVLVHGAWADGSGWKGVYDLLVKDGYIVSIVQEPLTSFLDDVRATKRVLAQQDGRCILVAHSYGGSVITEAGTDPSAAGLVYVAAHMPDAGESEAGDGKRFPSDLSKSGAIKKTADGFDYLDPARFREYFAADLPAEQAAFEARSQVMIADANFRAVNSRVEKQAELDVGSDERQNHQPRPRTVVCHPSQQLQGRGLGRQPLGLHLKTEGGCSSDRGGGIQDPLENPVGRAFREPCDTNNNLDDSDKKTEGGKPHPQRCGGFPPFRAIADAP
jgi:pimeloyl-ACP methyl ester carboxylesterase